MYAGDEQSMKTPIQLVIQYFLTLAFGIIGVMVVRNNGGKDHIDKCKNYNFSAIVNGIHYNAKLNTIIKEIMQAEFKNEWLALYKDQKNMFDISMYDIYSKNKLAKIDRNYGDLTNAFMLIGLYNKAFLDKLEDTLMPSQSENLHLFKQRTESKNLFRYKNLF